MEKILPLRLDEEKLLSFPDHLDIEATNHCQLRCVGCPRKFMKREQGFISWKTLKKIIEKVDGRVKTCYFHQMGDPLLHPDIIPMIRYIKNAGIQVGIGTNGILLTLEMSARLFDVGLDYLYLSLDSLKPETHAKITRSRYFDVIYNNIIKCLELRRSIETHKTYINLQMIRMEENISEVEEFRNRFEHGMERIGELSFKPYSMWAGHVADHRPHPHHPKPFVCTMINHSMSVYWNGDVVICCMDYDGFTKVGNIFEQDLEEIWNNKKYQEYRNAHKVEDFNKLKFCRGCYLASEFKLEYSGGVYIALGKQDYVPWLNFKVLELLEKITTKDSEIMETGSGNSTIWFARKAKRVVSYESKNRWNLAIQDVLREKNIKNVTFYYDQKYPDKSFQDKGPFDIIILDGDDGPGSRVKSMKSFKLEYLKPGGYLIVDDVDRIAYKDGVGYLDTLGLKKINLSGEGPVCVWAMTAIYQKI